MKKRRKKELERIRTNLSSKTKHGDSIKTRNSQPPDTGTPTLLQRPVDRPTLFLRLYPRDGGKEQGAISLPHALVSAELIDQMYSLFQRKIQLKPKGDSLLSAP
ncbi:hypothetical protein OUZ56_023082 [Daphnia magna]|uniref:Uncharacterized protein n=1 Tax=Daphnia magna TaxID=35525 RepID=A0ABR0AYA6_9CRUS|nr:hypothetical protein OUZ56_023082 [Daphnia magna]